MRDTHSAGMGPPKAQGTCSTAASLPAVLRETVPLPPKPQGLR